MSEKNPERLERPSPGETKPKKDPNQVAKDLGRTAIGGATKK
jgi:hypothetical protein